MNIQQARRLKIGQAVSLSANPKTNTPIQHGTVAGETHKHSASATSIYGDDYVWVSVKVNKHISIWSSNRITLT